MNKLMLVLSAIAQLVISTSMELIGNERGNVWFDDGTPDGVTAPPDVTPPPTTPPPATPTKQELLRELSKEYGVNLFEADGIKQFKEYQESQKTETQRLQEQLESYKTKESEWKSTQLEYQSKLKASELGIAQENLKDALKLAEGNPDNLVEVLKKYPMFKSNKGIRIGVTDPNNDNTPSGQTEKEQYMAKNKNLYGKYLNK